MTDAAVRIEGVVELRRAFRQLKDEVVVQSSSGDYTTTGSKRLKTAYREVSDMVAARAQTEARGFSALTRRNAPAIKASATLSRGPGLRVASSARFPSALIAFWGSYQRTGWFADPKYSGGRRQHPEWVGSSWRYGVKGEGPYAINEALADSIDDIKAKYEEAILRAARDLDIDIT